MNRNIIVLTGFLCIAAGLMTAAYHTTIGSGVEEDRKVLERIREGEEFLRHTDSASAEKSVSIFSELASKNLKANLSERVLYDLGQALEKTDQKMVALDTYRKLETGGISNEELKYKASYSLGHLLVLLNRIDEGRIHLEKVLASSHSKELRSMALTALADLSYKEKDYEKARKNYVLALQENPENTEARIGWARALKRLGKNWAAYDIFDDYMDSSAYFDPKEEKVRSEYKSSVYDAGRDQFLKKQYYGAIETLRKAISVGISPNLEEQALYYIAESYEAIGKNTEAIRTYNKILTNKVYSLDQNALFKKGTIYFKEGKFERAAAVLQEASDKYPENPVGKKALAWKREALRQIQERLEYKENSSVEPMDPSQYEPEEPISP